MVDTKVIATAVIGLFILALLTVFLSNGGFTSGRSKQAPTFLIAGPSGSGKTSLFTKWTRGKVSSTVASSSVNRYTKLNIPFDSEAVGGHVVVDLPGNAKLNFLTLQEIESHGDNLQGIIFMVDAAASQKALENAAHDLFRVLALTEKRNGGINVLVAANKSDVFSVISPSRVFSILEHEINELRNSKAKGIGELSTNEEDDAGAWIGLDGDFKFSQLEGSFQVLDGSVTAGRTQKWENWVEVHALNN